MEDLVLLGRAMYRKANLLRLGQVGVHKGEVICLGFSWDVAAGGVWKDSGLEMPASLAAHAACGKAAFDSLPARSGKTFFDGFFGVLPPHDTVLFGYMCVSGFMMAHALGFQDGFQFTLLPTLDKRGGVFGKFGDDGENMNWHLPFAEIASGADKAVSDELREIGGNVNLSLTSLNYVMGDEYMARAAAVVRLDSPEKIRRPAQLMATNQLKWLQSQSSCLITSRL